MEENKAKIENLETEKEYYTKKEVDSIFNEKLIEAMNGYIERINSLTNQKETKKEEKELTEKDLNF